MDPFKFFHPDSLGPAEDITAEVIGSEQVARHCKTLTVGESVEVHMAVVGL